jgi:hypothetical protein
VTTKDLTVWGAALDEGPADLAAIAGVETALKLARSGRIISAIKHLEAANPKISRGRAKMIVHSFGYGRELHWPEQEKWPRQNRQPVRCL